MMATAAVMAMACAGLGATASSASAGTPATATTSATTWGHDQNVPGVAALNTGYNAGIASLSCGSVGNCSAAFTASVFAAKTPTAAIRRSRQ